MTTAIPAARAAFLATETVPSFSGCGTRAGHRRIGRAGRAGWRVGEGGAGDGTGCYDRFLTCNDG